MTQAKILLQGEEQQLCILSGIVDGLEELVKHTKIKKWNVAFAECHDLLQKILEDRFLCFNDGGALQRLKSRVSRVKIGYLEGNNDYTRDGEDTFRCKFSADDIYDMAMIIQEQKCQNCHENKSACKIYRMFRKYDIEKFDEHPPKGICPYSVTLCEES